MSGKTITFTNGMIVVKNSDGANSIEPCSKTLSAEQIQEILSKHDFDESEDESK